MTVKTEGVHAGGFLVSEANKTRSREMVYINAGQVLKAGQVLGKLTVGGHYKAFDNALGDGSQTVAGILFDNVDTTAGEKKATVIVRDAEVNKEELVWQDSIDSGEQETALVALAALGIIAR